MAEARSNTYAIVKAILWVIAGIAVATWVIVEGVAVYQVMCGGGIAKATVIETSEDGAAYEFFVSGKRFGGQTELPLSKGETITVEFYPDDPRRNRATGDGQINTILGLLFAGLFASCAIGFNIAALCPMEKISVTKHAKACGYLAGSAVVVCVWAWISRTGTLGPPFMYTAVLLSGACVVATILLAVRIGRIEIERRSPSWAAKRNQRRRAREEAARQREEEKHRKQAERNALEAESASVAVSVQAIEGVAPMSRTKRWIMIGGLTLALAVAMVPPTMYRTARPAGRTFLFLPDKSLRIDYYRLGVELLCVAAATAIAILVAQASKRTGPSSQV